LGQLSTPRGTAREPSAFPALDLLASSAVAIPSSLARDAAIAGPLGTLAVSWVRPSATSLGLRALRWHADLERLGVSLPFSLVHDVGLVLVAPADQIVLGKRIAPEELGAAWSARMRRYGALLAEIAESGVARHAAELAIGDDVVTVVLARVLGSIVDRMSRERSYRADVPFDASLFEGIESQLAGMFHAVPRNFEAEAIDRMLDARLLLLTRIDALDLDTLRLLGMLGPEASEGALAHVDLFAVLNTPEANDIVNFSLEILPSVLESKTRGAIGRTASHGYAGIGTRGSIDSLVLTELAWSDLELARRLADSEVLYYAREESRDDARRIHYLLIDASASMRGDRQTFARGMAIATGKKLLLEGEDVAFRFFDARLYELRHARRDRLPTAHLLAFKGERGRNPTRVFDELSAELDVAQSREQRQVVVHLFTHAALYIPRERVAAVRRHAQIVGVFILPSGGELALDYLDLLSAHWVVDHASLTERDARASRAKTILDAGSIARMSERGSSRTQSTREKRA